MKILFLLITLAYIASCNDNSDRINSNSAGTKDSINNFDFERYPHICYSNKHKGIEIRTAYSGLTNDNYYYVKYNNTIGDTTNMVVQRIINAAFCDLKFVEFVEGEESDYLYLELLDPGGSMGNLGYYCILLNLETFEEFYYCIDNYPDGYFVRTTIVNNSDNFGLETFPASYLSKKLDKTLKSFEFTEPQQARYDFYLDNIKNNSLYNTQKLKFRKTKFKLFDIKPEPKDEGSSVNAFAENSRYIVVSYFGDATYCFDKQTKEFFCLWSPGSIYDNADCITFKDNNTVEIMGAGHNVSIKLRTGEYKTKEDADNKL